MYPTKKLGEICEIITWSTPKTSNLDFFWWDILWAWPADIWEEKYIFKTNKTLTDKWLFDGKARLVKKWSVLLVAIGTIWKVSIAGSDLTTNQQIHALQTEKNIIPEFLYYCLLSNKEKLKNQASSAVLAILNKSRLSNFLIPLPPLSTQKLIVEKLDMIFAEIEKSKNLLEKNLQNVDEMNKSVLEKIFANDKWEKKKLGEVCEIWPKKNEVIHLNENMFVSFVPMKDLKENEKWFDALEQKSIKEVYKWYTYFAENDVLLAKVTPCFENWKAWIAKNLVNNIWFGSSEFYVLRANKDILPEYIYYVIKQEKFLKHWKNNMSGAVGLQRVTKDFVVNFQIPLPPLETQKNIVSYLDNIFAENQKLKNLYQAQIKNLDEMKQSFLKKAFAGELV